MSQPPETAKVDQGKIAQFLEQKWKDPLKNQCPVCKSNSWIVGDILVELRAFSGGSLILGGPIVPLAAITCKVCGHTLMFNALVSGLVGQARSAIEPSQPIPKAEGAQANPGA
jgi:predicted nucleic-acid-binding Zn-ribbon protein